MLTSRKFLPYLLFVLSFTSFQAYSLLVRYLDVLESYLAYAVLYGSLLVLFYVFVAGVDESSPSRYGFVTFGRRSTLKTIPVAALFVAVFFLIALEPGFIYGFARAPNPSLLTFGFFLFSSPIVALAEEGIYRGYIFKRLATTGPFSAALLMSSALYALQLTNLSELGSQGLNGALQYLFTNTFTPFVLGIVMCLYFFKSGWSLLGPIIVRIGILLQSNLSPILARTPGFEFKFVFELLGFGGLIILINTLVKEPRFMARHYLEIQTGPKIGRFLRKAKLRAETRRTLMSVSIAGVVIVSAFAGSQYLLSSSFRLSAIATGSMQPTLGIGTLVVVQSISSPATIRVGDIIEYNNPVLGAHIVHRVIDVTNAKSGILYTTKGDYNTVADPAPVALGQVVGRVVFAVPYIGYTVLSPPLAVALVVLLLLSSLLGSSFKSKGRRGR